MVEHISADERRGYKKGACENLILLAGITSLAVPIYPITSTMLFIKGRSGVFGSQLGP